MHNRDTQFAWNYHNETKHSSASVRSNRHFLDFENYPLPFKVYPTLEPIPLPRDAAQSGLTALSTIAGPGVSPEQEVVPDIATLAQILYFSAGVTRTKKFPGGEIFFRAASCTGALYEIELYVVCGNLPGLAAGVYHFGAGDFALRLLRAGDFRTALVRATAGEPSVQHAPLILVSTGTYWRNAWKYQARTYRHFGWDNGTLHANLLAMCAAHRLPARVVCGFVDDDVNRLLDLDTQREVALTLVPIGHVAAEPPAPPEISPLHLETVPPSKKEVDYPSMREMHAASSLASVEEVAAWRGGPSSPRYDELRTEKIFPLEPCNDDEISRDTIEQVILRRGSSRKFLREPISVREFSTLLDRSTRGISADFALAAPEELLNDLYVIVHAVDGLAPGAYFFDRVRGALVCLKEGNFRDDAYYLGLEQDLPADAAAAIFYMADLRVILERFGNRGYRAAQLEAGILGGKLYLAAYAQRLGATGLTFYDDDVTQFFSPHAANKSAIFLMALGRSAKRSLVMPK
jgi:SagB-type dehydrogenase family enzyme